MSSSPAAMASASQYPNWQPFHYTRSTQLPGLRIFRQIGLGYSSTSKHVTLELIHITVIWHMPRLFVGFGISCFQHPSFLGPVDLSQQTVQLADSAWLTKKTGVWHSIKKKVNEHTMPPDRYLSHKYQFISCVFAQTSISYQAKKNTCLSKY